MSRCFTWLPIGDLGEPYISELGGCYKNRVGCGGSV